MTSGQGETPHGGSEGRPSAPPQWPAPPPDDAAARPGGGWPPPPPPPAPGWPPMPPPYPPGHPGAPQQQPGQGWPPPYPPGAPQPGGWGPPPRPVERPGTVRAGIVAFMAYLALAVIIAGIELSDVDGQVRQITESAGSTFPADLARTVVLAGLAIGLLVTCIEGLFVWFAWKGHNWARIVLWVLAGLTAVFGLAAVGAYSADAGFLRGLTFCRWALALAGIALMAMRPSNEWYRYCRWSRQAGRRG